MDVTLDRQAEAVRSSPAAAFRLGDVDVRPESGQVAGPRGQRQLDPKVMEVLVRLAAGDGQVVSRDELMRDVWPGVVVTDFALSRCIYRLRKDLGAVTGCNQPPIKTLPKRGYRLVWPLEKAAAVPQPAAGASDHWRRVIALAIVLLLAATFFLLDRPLTIKGTGPGALRDTKRLVVFPLDDLSLAGDQRVFARGLAQEVMHELAMVPGLVVVGRTSAFADDPDQQPILERAAQLRADYVLHGNLRVVGDSRRVLLELWSVPTGEQLWSRSFVLGEGAPFDVVSMVATQVSGLLEISLGVGRPRGSTSSLPAFVEFLAAFEASSQDSRRRHLLRAVELDPAFAHAWNQLAAMEIMPVWNGDISVQEAWTRAQPHIEKAMALAPDLPAAQITLGRFRREFGDMRGAIGWFRKALAQDPGNGLALANLGLVLRAVGDYAGALEAHREGVAMDPLDGYAVTRLASSYWFMENLEEAERQYQRAALLDPENVEIYDSWSGMLGMGAGRFDEALEKLEYKITLEGQPSMRSLMFRANLASLLGLNTLAQRSLEWARERVPESDWPDETEALHLLSLGNDDLARRVLLEAGLDLADIAGVQWMLGLLDLEAGRTAEFMARVARAYPELDPTNVIAQGAVIEAALVKAVAHQAVGQRESAAALLDAVAKRLGTPIGRDHYWMAAVHAMRGEPAAALAELRAAPPGRVRARAPLLLRDPWFASLRGNGTFEALVQQHLDELARQGAAYRARTGAE